MFAAFCGGILLASIAVAPLDAVGGCDASDEGCQASESATSLLQLDVRLKNVQAIPATVHAHKPELHEAQSIAAPLPFEDPLPDRSLSVITSHVRIISSHLREHCLHFLEAATRLVKSRTRTRTTDGASLWIVVAVLVMICICIIVLVPRLLFFREPIGVADQESEKRMGNARSLLQAPQSTNPAQSPIMASYGQPATSSPSNGNVSLPPICPSLILPHTEARFMIPCENIIRGQGELDIRGTSGRKLLHGSITDTPEGHRCLALASCGCEEDPRITILKPPEGYGEKNGMMDTLQIHGKGGKFYGTMEAGPTGGAIVRSDGQVVMSLELGGGDMRMTASAMDGRLLASAGKNVQVSVRAMECNDTWKLQVKPNCDAVLIAACMLGVLLFGPKK